MEYFLTLKLSWSERFRAHQISMLDYFLNLKYKTQKEYLWALKFSWSEGFSVLNERENNTINNGKMVTPLVSHASRFGQ